MAFPFGFGQQDMDGAEKPYEYRCIENAIEALWQEKRNRMSVKDIADYFHNSSDQVLKKISKQLQPWAYGRYAKFLVGESNIKFNNKLLVLELDGLNEEPELQTVVLNLVIAKISREMYLSTESEVKNHGKKLPKLIVIDEAWDLLRRPNTGTFIEKAYRRARKYECAVIIITQSFTDFDKTSAAKAALENSNWIITLVHDIGALEKAIDMNLLNISEYSKEMIKGLQKTNDYSELYVINKSVKGEGLYRLLVDPVTYWTYTTQGNEKVKLNTLLSSGIELNEAVEQLSK
jgi:conjugal transfer ATP-binding protein TraC